MADTIAVMNAGKIEQMGAPQEIYDLPSTAFAANFLGQTNLLPGKVVARGDVVDVEAFGQVFAIPASRLSTTSNEVIVGVRPEKMSIRTDGSAVPAGHNSVSGTVVDASFVGVSTQYLVRSAWGQDFIAFEQNLSTGDRPVRGDNAVVSWDPDNSFGLDGGDSLTAGIEEDLLEVGGYTAADVEAGNTPAGFGG